MTSFMGPQSRLQTIVSPIPGSDDSHHLTVVLRVHALGSGKRGTATRSATFPTLRVDLGSMQNMSDGPKVFGNVRGETSESILYKWREGTEEKGKKGERAKKNQLPCRCFLLTSPLSSRVGTSSRSATSSDSLR